MIPPAGSSIDFLEDHQHMSKQLIFSHIAILSCGESNATTDYNKTNGLKYVLPILITHTHYLLYLSNLKGSNHVVETIAGERVDSQDVISTFFQQVLAQCSQFWQPNVLLKAKVTEQYVVAMT